MAERTSIITRFAPSPTGPLHLGHAHAALVSFDLAREAGGQCLLRFEDIDQSRARPKWEAQAMDDLHWLGLDWPTPVMRQSQRMGAYTAALTQLWDRGVLYGCTCNRADIRAAASAPQEGAPLIGPDGIVYPGTCRAAGHPRGTGSLRLNMARALQMAGPLSFHEQGPLRQGRHQLSPDEMTYGIGDVVLARRDMGTSYHLSVVVDDAAQGVTHVTRGIDLFEATPIHVLLQALLDLPTPTYYHHGVIRDDAGKRLAKRDDAMALGLYRQSGLTPDDLRALIADNLRRWDQ